jgi:hypothetical protein
VHLVEFLVPNIAVKCADRVHVIEANALLRELRDAHQILQDCLRDLEKVLALPALDAAALTSARLKLAGLRLSRGRLVTRVHDLLSAHVSPTEDTMLEQHRQSHHRLLQPATVHTARWTLDAIAKNWADYRSETRELVRKWSEKANREQRFVYPLVQWCAQAV